MKKNLVTVFSMLLCTILAFSIITASADTYAEYNDWLLEIPSASNTTEYYIEEYNGSETSLVIPEKILDKNIVKINDKAFEDNTSLMYCTIPTTVTEIGKFAFNRCVELREMIIPESVSVIGNSAFYECVSLIDVKIRGGNLEAVPATCFTGCTSLLTVTVGQGVNSISSYSFSRCVNLRSIIIYPSVTSIAANAFNGCDNLTIRGFNGSYALEYAKANNIPYINLGEYVEPTEPATATDSSVEPTSSTGAEATSSMATEATEATSSTVTDATEATSSTAADATESIATEPTASSNASSTATEPTEEVTSSSSTQATDASESVSATANTNESASTTATATQASSSAGTTDSYKTYFIGDADLDGRITIKDATKIQKHIAKLLALDEIPLALADANNDTKVSVKDATQIQKFIAGFKDILFVGDEVKL